MMQLGSVFMTGFVGTTVTDELKRLLVDDELAGVILFKRNIVSRDQLCALTQEIRDCAGRPVLIGVDHEGGRVFRLPAPFTTIPPMRKVAAIAEQHPEQPIVELLGALMGRELAAAGINLNFAPVLDIDTNPQNPIIGDRAFGGDPRRVIRHALALMRGLQGGGVIPCGKHFPGHGDTPTDSHKSLPALPHTLDRLRLMELAPFQAAIHGGVPMIMTAHILYGALDAQHPATCSSRVLRGLLRDELDFKGVIITDDLEMGAITQLYTPDEAAVRSLAAGADLALICGSTTTTLHAITAVRDAIHDGRVSEELLAESRLRIRSLVTRHQPPTINPRQIGCGEHTGFITRTFG